MNKIILVDGSVIQAESITLEPHIVVQAADRAAFLFVWDKLTPENLSQVEVYINDIRVAQFEFCELIGTQTMHDGDSMTCHFYMTGTAVTSGDPVYEQAWNIIKGGQI